VPPGMTPSRLFSQSPADADDGWLAVMRARHLPPDVREDGTGAAAGAMARAT
jgi:hypothetical protein